MEQNPWSYVEIELAGEVFDDSVPEGTIAKQEPEPDTPIEAGGNGESVFVKGILSAQSPQRPREKRCGGHFGSHQRGILLPGGGAVQ